MLGFLPEKKWPAVSSKAARSDRYSSTDVVSTLATSNHAPPVSVSELAFVIDRIQQRLLAITSARDSVQTAQ